MFSDFRPYRCHYCDHRMRPFGRRCSNCYQRRAFYQHGVPVLMLAVVAAGTAALVLI